MYIYIPKCIFIFLEVTLQIIDALLFIGINISSKIYIPRVKENTYFRQHTQKAVIK